MITTAPLAAIPHSNFRSCRATATSAREEHVHARGQRHDRQIAVSAHHSRQLAGDGSNVGSEWRQSKRTPSRAGEYATDRMLILSSTSLAEPCSRTSRGERRGSRLLPQSFGASGPSSPVA